MSDRRSIEREKKYQDEEVCGITFIDILTEAHKLARRDGFLPSIFPKEKVLQSEVAITVIELTAFAAMNILRKKNGLEPLTEVSPLVSLAELASDDE